MEQKDPAPVFDVRHILPQTLRPTEAWVSVALCVGGATVPLFAGLAADYSLMRQGLTLALLVVGFASGINVVVARGMPWAKATALIPLFVCAGKLFMSCVAGAQS